MNVVAVHSCLDTELTFVYCRLANAKVHDNKSIIKAEGWVETERKTSTLTTRVKQLRLPQFYKCVAPELDRPFVRLFVKDKSLSANPPCDCD